MSEFVSQARKQEQGDIRDTVESILDSKIKNRKLGNKAISASVTTGFRPREIVTNDVVTTSVEMTEDGDPVIWRQTQLLNGEDNLARGTYTATEKGVNVSRTAMDGNTYRFAFSDPIHAARAKEILASQAKKAFDENEAFERRRAA